MFVTVKVHGIDSMATVCQATSWQCLYF